MSSINLKNQVLKANSSSVRDLGDDAPTLLPSLPL